MIHFPNEKVGIFIYIYIFSNSCNQYLCLHICAPVCVCMYAYYASNMGWHRQLFEVWLFTVHLIVYSHNGMGFLGGKATDFRVVVFLVGVKTWGSGLTLLHFSGKSSVKPWSFLDFCSGMDWLAGFFSINQRQELEELPLMEGIQHQLIWRIVYFS